MIAINGYSYVLVSCIDFSVTHSTEIINSYTSELLNLIMRQLRIVDDYGLKINSHINDAH